MSLSGCYYENPMFFTMHRFERNTQNVIKPACLCNIYTPIDMICLFSFVLQWTWCYHFTNIKNTRLQGSKFYFFCKTFLRIIPEKAANSRTTEPLTLTTRPPCLLYILVFLSSATEYLMETGSGIRHQVFKLLSIYKVLT